MAVVWLQAGKNPKAPKIEKIQYLPLGLKSSSEIEDFTRGSHQGPSRSRFLGKKMRRNTLQCRKGVFSEKGGGNSVNEGFGKAISTGKAIQ